MALITCSECGKQISDKAAACPNCGVGTAQAPAPIGNCPRCRTPMNEGRRGSVTVLGCGRCGGVWLDNPTAQRLVKSGDSHVVAMADEAAAHASVLGVPSGPCACPVCSQPLREVMVPPSGVHVDVCDLHGTWFDRGEIQKASGRVPPPVATRVAEPQSSRLVPCPDCGTPCSPTATACPKCGHAFVAAAPQRAAQYVQHYVQPYPVAAPAQKGTSGFAIFFIIVIAIVVAAVLLWLF
jgi:Zn-finger nucleic acid-binding protein